MTRGASGRLSPGPCLAPTRANAMVATTPPQAANTQVAFALGIHRPEGTLVQGDDEDALHPLLHGSTDADLRRIQRDIAAGKSTAAYRRAKVLHDAPDRQLDDGQRAQLQFDLGVSSVSLGRLAAAEKHFSSCEAALSRSDPALLPCLLNHGLVLLRLCLFEGPDCSSHSLVQLLPPVP